MGVGKWHKAGEQLRLQRANEPAISLTQSILMCTFGRPAARWKGWAARRHGGVYDRGSGDHNVELSGERAGLDLWTAFCRSLGLSRPVRFGVVTAGQHHEGE